MRFSLLCAAAALLASGISEAGTRSVMRSKTTVMSQYQTVQHIGSIAPGATHEGNGVGSTRREAVRNACFSNSGMRVTGRSVSRGADGRFYSSTSYRSR